MFEYQIFVDNGKLSFATQWDADKSYAHDLAIFLYDKFGAENVSVFRRSLVMERAAKGIDAIEALFDSSGAI
jgi:hypothetical protein